MAGRTAYFLSKHHEVVAIHASSGRILWTQTTGASGEATGGSRVVCADGRVIVGDEDIVALSGDGRTRWRFARPHITAPGVYLGDASGGMVYAGSASGYVSAIDLESGRLRWTARAGDAETTAFAPAADEQMVVAGFTTFAAPMSGGVVAWDSRTGRERWRVPLPASGSPGGLTGGPVLGGRLVAATSRDGTIVVVERQSGRVVRILPAVGEAAIPGGEVVSQDFRALLMFDRGRALLAGSLTGVVVAYDLETGAERWRRRPVSASIGFTIAADSDGTAYVPYLSGPLVAIELSTGHERWRTGAEAGFSWAPWASAGRIYAAGSRGGFFALMR